VTLFDIASIEVRLSEIELEIQIEGFWEDQERTQKVLKEKKALEKKRDLFEKLKSDFETTKEMLELAIDDETLAEEVMSLYTEAKESLEEFKIATLLCGKHDANNAIFTVHAGTGGVEAMDWAEMLLRMYTRWAAAKGYECKVLDLQDDTEAGIKSATVLVEGENAYGYLKNERGVHRLVRISPFNAQGKRQTSFASLEVIPELPDDIQIDIKPEDLKIDTYRASGAGGQHVNKTDSAIRITHLPTNIVVTCQNERSQYQNKDMAMKILIGKLTELAEEEQKENLAQLKGDYSQNTWGSQIRSYVFQPYTLVKDHRTGAENGNVSAVMDGDLDYFINEKLKQSL
jgi:peptide chain release factor 2